MYSYYWVILIRIRIDKLSDMNCECSYYTHKAPDLILIKTHYKPHKNLIKHRILCKFSVPIIRSALCQVTGHEMLRDLHIFSPRPYK